MSVEELERARGDAAAAAEAGQQLLKTLAEVRQEKEHALQQVHQLRLSLDSKEKTVENLQEEVANLKVDQSKAIQAKDEEILELKRGRSILQDEMSQSVDGLVLQLQEKSLEAEEGNAALKKLQLELKEAQAKLENQDGCGGSVGSSRLRTAEETIEVLTEKLNQVEAEKERLGEAQESLLKDNTDLAERVEGLTTELSAVKMSLEETENELVGYQASMTQVKVEMDQMQSKLQEGDAGCVENRRGNSLFSEVDDRRKIVEDKLRRAMDKMEEAREANEKKSKQLAKAQKQNMALLKKRPDLSGGVGGLSGATLRHMEELLMRERAKNTSLMQQIQMNAGGTGGKSTAGNTSLESQIRQTVLAEDMLVEANRTVAKLEKSEANLKSENSRLKYELESLKENKVKPTSLGSKTEALNFKKQPVKNKQQPVSLLSSGETTSNRQTSNSSAKVKNSSSGDNLPAVAEKKARFAESVVTHEYVESETEVNAKSKNVTSAINAKQEVEKVENECKQS